MCCGAGFGHSERVPNTLAQKQLERVLLTTARAEERALVPSGGSPLHHRLRQHMRPPAVDKRHVRALVRQGSCQPVPHHEQLDGQPLQPASLLELLHAAAAVAAPSAPLGDAVVPFEPRARARLRNRALCHAVVALSHRFDMGFP